MNSSVNKQLFVYRVCIDISLYALMHACAELLIQIINTPACMHTDRRLSFIHFQLFFRLCHAIYFF